MYILELCVHLQSCCVINLLLTGKPNITEGTDEKGNELGAVDLSSTIFTSEEVQLIENQLAVAVNVYKVPTLFPLPIHETGPETLVGTPVVSMIVAGDGKQLDIFDQDPLIQLTLEITVEVNTPLSCVCHYTHIKSSIVLSECDKSTLCFLGLYS